MNDFSSRQEKSSLAVVLLIVIAGACILAMVAAVLLVLLAGGSAGGTLRSGRNVVTHSDSLFLTSNFSGDTATIKTAGKVIVVAPGKLRVDGKTIAVIPPETMDVEIHVRRGTVEFIADGKSIRN